MTQPVEVSYTPGATLYFVVHHIDGTVWNGTTWEAFNPANWTTYAQPMTEQAGSGYYRGDYPSAIVGVLTTEAIYAQAGVSPALSDAPSVGLGQSQGSNIVTVAGSKTAADNMGVSGGTMTRGTVQSGVQTTSSMVTNLPATLTDAYKGRAVIWTSGVLANVAAAVTAFNHTTGVLSFTAVPAAPSAADTFIIV